MQKKRILNNPLASNTASVRCNNMLNVIFLNFQNFNKMKNSILKSALSTFAAKKEVSTKNFEVITSLETIRGGLAAALGCTNCKKKQTQVNN